MNYPLNMIQRGGRRAGRAGLQSAVRLDQGIGEMTDTAKGGLSIHTSFSINSIRFSSRTIMSHFVDLNENVC